jgi:hypothetical protein
MLTSMKTKKSTAVKVKSKVIRDTHLYFDEELRFQIEEIARDEDRSVTAAIRVLIKEALAARLEEVEK